MRIRTLVVAACTATLLLVAAATAQALPPQYPAAWTTLANGVREMKNTVDTRAFCKGPSGTVYEVALGQTTAYYAAIARIRVSDGRIVRSWTYPATPGSAVIPRAAASDHAGDLYVAAESQAGKRNWVVVKFSSSGKRLWTRFYDSGNGQDTPYGMAVDHHGNVIVAGTSEAAGGYDSAVVKWSATGKFRWRKMISAPGLDLVGAVAVDADDNVYAAGDRGETGGAGTAIVRSWTPGGRQRWTATAVNAGQMPAWRYVVVRGKAVYVAGQSTGVPSTNSLMAMKYTTSGKRAWSGLRLFTFPNGAWTQGLAVDHAGAVILVGRGYDFAPAGEDRGVVWKLTAAGGTAWYASFADPDFPLDGQFGAVAVDGADRIYAAGGKYYSSQTANLLMVRYSPTGTEQAMWRADGQQSGYCSFSHLLVLSGQVLAAGQVQGWVGGVNADACVYRAKTTAP